MMAIEEMSELITALAKYKRNINNSTIEDIIEEIIDVEIMLQQLKLIFIKDNSKYVSIKHAKLERLRKLLGMEEVKPLDIKGGAMW